MAHIQRRGPSRWRVRYREADGRERSRTFTRKGDAERFLISVQHSVWSGTYLDPAAGRITLRTYAEQWFAQQDYRERSGQVIHARLTKHVYPHLGARPIASIQPSDIRSWQKAIRTTLSPGSAANVRTVLHSVLDAAVLDQRIRANPIHGIKAPKAPKRRTPIPTIEQVDSARAVLLDRYRAVVDLVEGSGVRQAEAFGLTRNRVNFLRKHMVIDRQLVGRNKDGSPIFGPPKTNAGNRTIPLHAVTIRALSQHLAKYPAGADELIFRTARGSAVLSSSWSPVWKAAREAAGFEPGEGLRLIRHFYASLLIAAGRSVKEVQHRLGHDSAVITLDVYADLWPDNEDGTREAIGAALGQAAKGRATG